jgi:hypothetical protein
MSYSGGFLKKTVRRTISTYGFLKKTSLEIFVEVDFLRVICINSTGRSLINEIARKN